MACKGDGSVANADGRDMHVPSNDSAENYASQQGKVGLARLFAQVHVTSPPKKARPPVRIAASASDKQSTHAFMLRAVESEPSKPPTRIC